MKTVWDRIAYILEDRKISGRELARRAEIAEQHIGVIKARFEKDAKASVELETLEKIARGGHVSLAWLATGKGSPEDKDDAPARAIVYDDRYPARQQIVEMARAKGVSEGAIRALQFVAFKGDGDPGLAYWARELDALIRADAWIGPDGIRVPDPLPERDEDQEGAPVGVGYLAPAPAPVAKKPKTRK